MLSNGAELSLQASGKFAALLKKFTITSDLEVVFIGGDSPRFGHEPAFIPPSPSVDQLNQ